MKKFFVAGLLIVVTQVPTEASSLWDKKSPANRFFTDGNAGKVGDILTILIDESTSATELADTESKRKTTLLGRFSALFNNDFAQSVFGNAGGGGNIDYPAIQFDGQNDFKGENDVERRGTFEAKIAASIVMIDENGNYHVEARKTIKVGKETKSIILTGIVRPRDISAQNTVQSSQIADAQISYEGTGPITGGAEPGLFTKALRFFF